MAVTRAAQPGARVFFYPKCCARLHRLLAGCGKVMSARETCETSGKGVTWRNQSSRVVLVAPVSFGLPVAREMLAYFFSILLERNV